MRKDKGLTQEELAEILYVSRTTVSKWESARGWPSIDSLKDISAFFNVSIDDLLSGDKLISIAEKENKSNIRNICSMLYGIVDLFSVLLIILPLYPYRTESFVYSVSLFNHTQISSAVRFVYGAVFSVMVLMGLIVSVNTKLKEDRNIKLMMEISLAINCLAVMILGLGREAYAVTVAFLLLAVKVIIAFRYMQNKKMSCLYDNSFLYLLFCLNGNIRPDYTCHIADRHCLQPHAARTADYSVEQTFTAEKGVFYARHSLNID